MTKDNTVYGYTVTCCSYYGRLRMFSLSKFVQSFYLPSWAKIRMSNILTSSEKKLAKTHRCLFIFSLSLVLPIYTFFSNKCHCTDVSYVIRYV